MSLKSDRWIREMSLNPNLEITDGALITPFSESLVRRENDRAIVSYGLSSYGYDIRVAREFKIFTNINTTVIDPKAFDPNSFVDIETDVCIIPPNSFVLARSVERIIMPRTVLAVCIGKSTYARCGLIVNVTPLEPGWQGYITVEISNTTPLPAKVYANEGIAQLLFFESNEPCMVSYADRFGKYMDQPAIPVVAKT